jgi:hypothetical protein
MASTVTHRRPNKIRLAVLTALAALLLTACGGGQTTGSPPTGSPPSKQAGGGMGQGMNAAAPRVPPVFGYYDGQQIFFIHTEASDQQIAQVLQKMMGSPVPVVQSLAQVPDQALSELYVFTNGVKPQDTPLGPLNFQPDVFATAPSEAGYSPLVRIVRVTWKNQAQARVLKSEQEITKAKAAGQLTLTRTDVVVTAPLLTWPGGHR